MLGTNFWKYRNHGSFVLRRSNPPVRISKGGTSWGHHRGQCPFAFSKKVGLFSIKVQGVVLLYLVYINRLYGQICPVTFFFVDSEIDFSLPLTSQ